MTEDRQWVPVWILPPQEEWLNWSQDLNEEARMSETEDICVPTDITVRLRRKGCVGECQECLCEVGDEAADLIEHLRAEIEELRAERELLIRE